MRLIIFIAVACCLAACSSNSPDSEPATQTISLFNGQDLTGWHADIPRADGGREVPPSFVAQDGILVSKGRPQGHLITDRSFRDYRLKVEWRWPEKPGNCATKSWRDSGIPATWTPTRYSVSTRELPRRA